MPLPSFRPDGVLKALAAAFQHQDVWPKALIDPDAHHQKMAMMYRYIAETRAGYVLTDLGRREIAT